MQVQYKWLSLLGFVSLVLLGALSATGCGSEPVKITATFLSPTPEERTFNKGLLTLRVSIDKPDQVKRAAIALHYKSDKTSVVKELIRQDSPPGNWEVDWDTTKEKDGTYELELQILQSTGHVQQVKRKEIWVVNKPAQLVIKECNNPPLVTKDKIKLTLEWKNAPKNLPPTTIDLFVQGESEGPKNRTPYVYNVDLSKYKDDTEVYLNAVATRGIFSGASSVCSVRIDRKGPRVKFLYPAKDGNTIPGKFSASVEVEEEFGIKEVRVTVAGKVVGRLTKPPFQVPVDLTKSAKDGDTITLKVIGVDLAGNESEKPHELKVKVDTKAPIVTIKSPEEKKNYPNDINFEVDVQDNSGLGFVDIYILDDKGKRVDNILHRDGQGSKKTVTYADKINTPITSYGTGTRKLEVVARDIHGNITTMLREFIIGCKTPADCPASPNPNTPYLCLGNRSLIPRNRGERCTYGFSCKPPLICHFGGLNYCAKEKLGICRQVCQPSKNECQVGEFCLEQKTGPSVCFPGDACGPFTYNCGEKQQCTPWGSDTFICIPAGFAKVGEPCKPFDCNGTLNCAKGLLCVPTGNGNGQLGSASKGVCRKLCDQEFPQRDCKGQEICQYFTLRDKNSNSIGYCK